MQVIVLLAAVFCATCKADFGDRISATDAVVAYSDTPQPVRSGARSLPSESGGITPRFVRTFRTKLPQTLKKDATVSPFEEVEPPESLATSYVSTRAIGQKGKASLADRTENDKTTSDDAKQRLENLFKSLESSTTSTTTLPRLSAKYNRKAGRKRRMRHRIRPSNTPEQSPVSKPNDSRESSVNEDSFSPADVNFQKSNEASGEEEGLDATNQREQNSYSERPVGYNNRWTGRHRLSASPPKKYGSIPRRTRPRATSTTSSDFDSEDNLRKPVSLSSKFEKYKHVIAKTKPTEDDKITFGTDVTEKTPETYSTAGYLSDLRIVPSQQREQTTATGHMYYDDNHQEETEENGRESADNISNFQPPKFAEVMVFNPSWSETSSEVKESKQISENLHGDHHRINSLPSPASHIRSQVFQMGPSFSNVNHNDDNTKRLQKTSFDSYEKSLCDTATEDIKKLLKCRPYHKATPSTILQSTQDIIKLAQTGFITQGLFLNSVESS